MKVFKYQITVTALLYKHKLNGKIEYSPGYFNLQLKQRFILNIVLINLFKIFYTE